MAKKRTRVPKLTGERLRSAIEAIQLLPIRPGAKLAIISSLLESSAPNRHDLDNIGGVQHGPNLKETAAAMSGHQRETVDRVNGLISADMDQSDEDWMADMERRFGPLPDDET